MKKRLAALSITLVGLGISLVVANVLVILFKTDGLVRYPESGRIGNVHLRLDTLAKGYMIQDSAYRSADELPAVLGWYSQNLKIGPDTGLGGMGNCVSLRKSDEHLLFRQMIGITLCSWSEGTLIFVNRSLEIH